MKRSTIKIQRKVFFVFFSTLKDETTKNRKSKQQLEDEKRAILSQRVKPLDISGFNPNKLVEKAKELHNIIYKLEGEKYDLEKHFKAQQFDVSEMNGSNEKTMTIFDLISSF